MKDYIVIGLLCFLCCNVNAQFDDLRINQLQVIGSHNSYKKEIEPNLYNFLEERDSTHSMQSLQYAHISILKQLDMGLRNLEIDVFADSKGGRYAHPKGLDVVKANETYDPDKEMLQPGFKVFHMLDIDFRTHYYTLEACLKDLKLWSDAHPNHEPIFITLEAKDGVENIFGTKAEDFTSELFNLLDVSLINGLGKHKIIKPDDVRGPFSTLEAAVLKNNWPKLKASRGKFLFILDDSGRKRDLYIKDHASLKGRAMFVNANPGTAEAATLFRNNPEDNSIQVLVSKGYIVRTRADAGTKEARLNEYSHFEKAKHSGAQIITTDYYLPSKLFKSEYHIFFKNNTYVRANPVTGN
ncbi:phosphatidylinositol-specific phospholipase C1-like protein [uncultured Formosa sp.]|uniref:phosphatidylinositol-specific phospholipase C1-like protein n=1 Tax=uncultured Formosa sp. TaxID=255435 RepID=UPI00263644D5|nr:phosphatidylinositol-specific phospholipase C1-like protein [uncultured Formosa sp.]